MKKKIFCLLSFLMVGAVYSQMYVAPNSYMYVGDQFVYVTGNVELNAATSNIYLRKDGQLLQGTAAVGGSNIGLGALSVYQEGSVNNFQYNYWCSPVGGSLAVSGNSAFGIPQLGAPTSVTATNAATILPIGNLNGASGAGSVSIAPYWIWKFTTSNAYAQWVQVASASTLNAGQGFTMKGTSGTDATVPFAGAGANNGGSAQRYDFRGKPNDGTINVAVTAGMQTLTGNPYPSAIDMQLFLTDPTNTALCDGTALYWEHDKTVNSHLIAAYRGGYGVYNGATNVYTPATFYTYTGTGAQGPVFSTPLNSYQRKFAPVGQGFMIRGIAAGNVQLKNTHRAFRREGAVNNSQFEKNASSNEFYEEIPNVAGIDYTQISKAPTPHIKINASLNDQAVRQIALVFKEGTLEGYDKADAKSSDVDANLPFDMYLYLDNTEYVQSARPFDIMNKYPLGFKNNENASFRIQVADFVNFSGAENVYLHDKELDVYYDIKNSEQVVTLPTGVNNSKYEITFVNNSTLHTNDDIANSFNIYQNNGENMLTIKNPNLIDLASYTLFDITGKLVLTKNGLGSNASYEFSTAQLSQGVYVVKLITKANQEITKKVSISNKK